MEADALALPASAVEPGLGLRRGPDRRHEDRRHGPRLQPDRRRSERRKARLRTFLLAAATTLFAHRGAGISPKPAAARFHACNALYNNGKEEAAIAECKQAIAAEPNQWEFYQVLGGAQNTLEKSEEALETYEKGAEAAKKMLEEKPDSGRAKTGLGQILNAEGNLLVHMKKYEQAIEIFSQAAEVSAYPAMPYFNLCATFYNLKRSQDAVAACDRAIIADPTLSDAYFIKASILFGEGRTEAGRYVVPAGTTDSLNKYLQYAPFGEHANDVRSMIDRVNGEIPYKLAKP